MANILQILTDPDPKLRKISKELNVSAIKNGEYKNFFRDLIYTMKKKDGVGLAAPQVGEKIRVFVVNTDFGPEIIINPHFTRRSWAKELGEEGCLSVPNVYGDVLRHKSINVRYLNSDGKKITKKIYGLLARIYQHENDHLDGILFTDKAVNIKKI